jgi:cell division initiation protein
MPKLTPLDIRKQEFPQRFRGYDPDEVDTFLDLIADDAEGLTNERNQLQDRVATLESQLAEFREMERSLRDALVMAEKMSRMRNDGSIRCCARRK